MHRVCAVSASPQKKDLVQTVFRIYLYLSQEVEVDTVASPIGVSDAAGASVQFGSQDLGAWGWNLCLPRASESNWRLSSSGVRGS